MCCVQSLEQLEKTITDVLKTTGGSLVVEDLLKRLHGFTLDPLVEKLQAISSKASAKIEYIHDSSEHSVSLIGHEVVN